MHNPLALTRHALLTLLLVIGVTTSNSGLAKEFEKNDGRITFSVKTGLLDGRVSKLVKSATVEAQWWTLLGQPVEYYKFKWERQKSFQYGSSYVETLHRNDLVNYPDLVERYDSLRPLDIELKMRLKFYSNSAFIDEFGYGPRGYYRLPSEDRRFFATGTKTISGTPHLMIVSAGNVGDNLTPVSPRSWSDFIQYFNGNIPEEQIEDKSREVFKYASSLEVSSLDIKSIVLPNEQAKAIHDELKRREETKDIAVDDFWNGDEEELEINEDRVNDADSDFWYNIDPDKNIDKDRGDELSFWNETTSQEVANPERSVKVKVPTAQNSIKGDSGLKSINEFDKALNFASNMIEIDAGDFLMGSPVEEVTHRGRKRMGGIRSGERQHLVSVDRFSIGKYEVTQLQWRSVMGTNPSYNEGCDLCPVERVSGEMALNFLMKLNEKTGRNYRLATEAEWEYAARAGANTPFQTGDCIGFDAANFGRFYPSYYSHCGDQSLHRDELNTGSKDSTTPVGSYKPNSWGLYDVHGNVEELTCSWYAEEYDGNESYCGILEYPNTRNKIVARGGSIGDEPEAIRFAYRQSYSMDYGSTTGLGLRLAHD